MIVLAKALVKVFGGKFYRVNSTFLLYATILLFGYGVFIKTAGHIPDAEQHRYLVFSMLLAFIQTPVFGIVVYTLWVFYTVKSWRFIWKESLEPDHLFWRYSASALPRHTQFAAWFLYQLFIFIPLLIYWLLVGIYAVTIAEYGAFVLTALVILLLALASAAVYVYRFNGYVYGRGRSGWLFRLSRRWKKPLPAIPLLEVLLHRKASFLLVKGLSAMLFAVSAFFLADADRQWLVAYTMVASMALAHSILAYPVQLFLERHLYFLQQLPIPRATVYGATVISTLLLVLPELIGLFVLFDSSIAVQSGLILLSGALVTQMTNYLSGPAAWVYIRYTFAWYIVTMILLLYAHSELLIAVQFILSYIVFHVCYFRRKAIPV